MCAKRWKATRMPVGCCVVVMAAVWRVSSWAQPSGQGTLTAPSVSRTVLMLSLNGKHPVRIPLRAPAPLPRAAGTVEISEKRGELYLKAEYSGLEPPRGFGPEYLTYVLWIVTPEGGAVNLGEARPEPGSNTKAPIAWRRFGLVVTAEPYAAASVPSDIVVLQSAPGGEGVQESGSARFQLLPRGYYAAAALGAAAADPAPLEIREARNAIAIAKWAGAERLAPEGLQRAMSLLKEAEDAEQKGASQKAVDEIAAQAVQAAEDARAIAMRRRAH
jgi:hypothetical protein